MGNWLADPTGSTASATPSPSMAVDVKKVHSTLLTVSFSFSIEPIINPNSKSSHPLHVNPFLLLSLSFSVSAYSFSKRQPFAFVSLNRVLDLVYRTGYPGSLLFFIVPFKPEFKLGSPRNWEPGKSLTSIILIRSCGFMLGESWLLFNFLGGDTTWDV